MRTADPQDLVEFVSRLLDEADFTFKVVVRAAGTMHEVPADDAHDCAAAALERCVKLRQVRTFLLAACDPATVATVAAPAASPFDTLDPLDAPSAAEPTPTHSER